MLAEGSFYKVAFSDNAGAVFVFCDKYTADFVMLVFCCGGYDGIVFVNGYKICIHDFFDNHVWRAPWFFFLDVRCMYCFSVDISVELFMF